MNDWKTDTRYYHFNDDLKKYPDCWCYVVWSRRGPGKTYSCLRYAYEEKIPIVYIKRTKDDIEVLCNNRAGIDTSPYVPICRDAKYRIEPQLIGKGIGGFYDFYPDGERREPPFSYCAALNTVKSIKGMDLSFCDWLVLDEFIPQRGEIVRRAEGDMLLDFYMTVARDREKRGREPLKLVLFANAENIACPITSTLEIIDSMSEMQVRGETHRHIQERGILLHHITEEEIPITDEEKTGIYKGMAGTSWHEKSFGGDFSNNDFSCVGKMNMKNFAPLVGFRYKRKNYYIYRKGEQVYVCKSFSKYCEIYDLDRETEQKRFYYDYVINLRNDMIEGNMTFSSYTTYDLFSNYRQIFKI